ncbi:TraU family protein [Vibrio tritonius]|uniref:TraU family protein n=1 Tax=Vibrio tritonius TaxID=1435069 RepID=A0ABS7YH26_9VIBR|nr:TraU family protein [Vibrio tritonius]MCA2014638.1 TraU family protein [Vibrio tritonius]
MNIFKILLVSATLMFTQLVFGEDATQTTDAVNAATAVAKIESAASSLASAFKSASAITSADLTSGAESVYNLMLNNKSGTDNTTSSISTTTVAKINESQKTHWNLINETKEVALDKTKYLAESLNCTRYSVVGICISYTISLKGIHFHTHIAVEHYVRDLHVEVSSKLPSDGAEEYSSNTPIPSSTSVAGDIALVYPLSWKLATEYGGLIDVDSGGITSAFTKLGKISGQTTYSKNSQYLYRDAQVSGNIEGLVADAFLENTIGVVGWCQSPAVAGVVYFNSALDMFSWRWIATSETVLTALYQVKYLKWNDIGGSYGSMMPRQGFINTRSNYKAAIIAAYRALSIAGENRSLFSSTAGLHIANPLSPYAKKSLTGSKYLTPQDASKYGFRLTQVYPYRGDSCTTYSALDTPAEMLALEKSFNKGNHDHSAIFKVWRPYRCCKKQGHKLIDIISSGVIGTPS